MSSLLGQGMSSFSSSVELGMFTQRRRSPAQPSYIGLRRKYWIIQSTELCIEHLDVLPA